MIQVDPADLAVEQPIAWNGERNRKLAIGLAEVAAERQLEVAALEQHVEMLRTALANAHLLIVELRIELGDADDPDDTPEE